MIVRLTFLLCFIFCQTAMAMIDVTKTPDQVRVIAEDGTVDSAVSDLARVVFEPGAGTLSVGLSAPKSAVKRIELHWNGSIDPNTRLLGDEWERAYADLGWRSIDNASSMPWYFMAHSGDQTDGYGVMTEPAAMCSWKIDAAGVTLVADVRCGTAGVQLGDRKLKVCTVVCHAGKKGESAFDATTAFCRQMCPHPRLPKMPVYGYNDWNSTYGHNTAEHFIRDARTLAELAPDGPNRPYMVVDDGWQANRQGGKNDEDPWDRTNAKFGSTMPEWVKGVKALNAHAGLWYRPLEAWHGAAPEWLLSRDQHVFDPSVKEVRQKISDDVHRFRSWGIELVKFDFTTVEIFGEFGNKMGENLTNGNWTFADRSKTSAEIVSGLYHTIRDAAGDDIVIDGCNTISHLSAGVFELCRIGDDTSGTDWHRTRAYGINALAFRAPQQGAFYQADPDMVGLAKANAVPWEKNSQWLDLVARSGTTLFISWKADLFNDEIRSAVRQAFKTAAKPREVCRPVDWMETKVPTHWIFDSGEATYTW